MLPTRETLLCRYRYDALDRLVDCTPSAQAPTRRFYLKDRLATEIQGVVQRSIMQHNDQLLAQQQRQSGAVEACLLATDQQRSVLNVLDASRPHPLAYSPYGHRPAESGLLSLLGFNGERPDPVTGGYLLGNGYRAFNPVLMRFNSPDSWSPFGEGGLNAYAYCVGDPVNHADPSGHSIWIVRLAKGIGNFLGARTPASSASVSRGATRSPQSGDWVGGVVEGSGVPDLAKVFAQLSDDIDAGVSVPREKITPWFIEWRIFKERSRAMPPDLPTYEEAGRLAANSSPPDYNNVVSQTSPSAYNSVVRQGLPR